MFWFMKQSGSARVADGVRAVVAGCPSTRTVKNKIRAAAKKSCEKRTTVERRCVSLRVPTQQCRAVPSSLSSVLLEVGCCC